MGYRSFQDTRGTDWQAWDVVPALADRRRGERRVQRADFSGDRRRATDRRVTVGRRPVLSAGLNGGWLCFEATEEKRRLTPIPSGWLNCTVHQLELYCESATLVPRISIPIVLPNLSSINRG